MNDISIDSAVFVGLKIVTDRQTYRPTDHHATASVTIRRFYVRRTATQPKNEIDHRV